MVMLGVLVVIVLACLAAPLYANDIAHTDPFRSNLDGTTIVNGKTVPVMPPTTTGLGLGSTPIGPTWDPAHYFLGADDQGRDVAARLLYGGRNSLMIGTAAALITCLLRDHHRHPRRLLRRRPRRRPLASASTSSGRSPSTCSRSASRRCSLTQRPLARPGRHPSRGASLLPILIIGIVYIPYVARPIRGEVLSLRQREFVEAAEGLGASTWRRALERRSSANVVTTAIVFFPLMVAIDMLTEAALSFLSIGVQPPDASWGTIILDGQGLLYTRPVVALAPGIAIAVTVLALNVLGDGVRDALDPRAKLGERD